jgi:hypothetical protein
MPDPHVIETRRLILRPLTAADCTAFHALLVEPGVRRYLLDDEVVTLDWVVGAIADSVRRFAVGDLGLWALRLRAPEPDTDAAISTAVTDVVGFCGFRDFLNRRKPN